MPEPIPFKTSPAPDAPSRAAPASRYADERAARQALSMALPAIERALQDPAISGLGVLHVVVMNPAAEPGSCRFEEAVLYEDSIGDRTAWDVDYAAYAHDKARLSWQHRIDSRLLQWMQPHRLRADEPAVWGGVWLDGIVVAASGAFPIWDEAFAMCIAANLRAIAAQRAEAERAGVAPPKPAPETTGDAVAAAAARAKPADTDSARGDRGAAS